MSRCLSAAPLSICSSTCSAMLHWRAGCCLLAVAMALWLQRPDVPDSVQESLLAFNFPIQGPHRDRRGTDIVSAVYDDSIIHPSTALPATNIYANTYGN